MVLFLLYDIEKSYVNDQNAWEKLVRHQHFFRQSAASVRHQGSVWYRWSRISSDIAQLYFYYHLQTGLVSLGVCDTAQVGLDTPAEKKDIVTIIGCPRPEVQTERVWEAVCFSIATNIETIVGCSISEGQIGGVGGRLSGCN